MPYMSLSTGFTYRKPEQPKRMYLSGGMCLCSDCVSPRDSERTELKLTIGEPLECDHCGCIGGRS